MSMGFYYTARRNVPISQEEDSKITEITNKYCEKYTLSKGYEGPGRFSCDNGNIYEGMIRIPLERIPQDIPMEKMESFFIYWLKWLTDITRVLHNAEWEAAFEDVPLVWEEKTGWRMMSNQEYGEFNNE